MFSVCFAFGLGDRHLNNILINEKTGALVHIDLGMVFDFSSRHLKYPERVPFRLTRDIVDPILIDGIQGRFTNVAIHALKLLRENADIIEGVASQILFDPITSFEMKDEVITQHFLESALHRLRLKLEGSDDISLNASPEEQVSQQTTQHVYDPLFLFYLLFFSGCKLDKPSEGSQQSLPYVRRLDALYLTHLISVYIPYSQVR